MDMAKTKALIEPTSATMRRRRPKPLDRETVTLQVAQLARLARSFTILAENLALDLGMDIGIMPDAPSLPEAIHATPKTPNGATVHVEPKTISAWIEPASTSAWTSSQKLDKTSSPAPASSSSSSSSSPPPSSSNGSSPAPLKKGMREILRVLAAVGMALTKQRIATLTGLSIKSGTFSDYLSALRTRGFIVDAGEGKIALTDDGRLEAGDVDDSANDEEKIRAMWQKKLKKGMREMLAVLARLHPTPLTRTNLGTLARLSSKSGSFGDYLSKLRTNALIEDDGIHIRLTAEGLIVAGPKSKPLTKDEILEQWSDRLKAGARRMLEALVAVDGSYLSYVEIGAAHKNPPTPWTFTHSPSTLTTHR